MQLHSLLRFALVAGVSVYAAAAQRQQPYAVDGSSSDATEANTESTGPIRAIRNKARPKMRRALSTTVPPNPAPQSTSSKDGSRASVSTVSITVTRTVRETTTLPEKTTTVTSSLEMTDTQTVDEQRTSTLTLTLPEKTVTLSQSATTVTSDINITQTVDEQRTSTVTLPDKTVTLPAKTVTLPQSTVTLSQSTLTVTLPQTTITLPGTTVTQPASTITVTESPTSSISSSTTATSGSTTGSSKTISSTTTTPSATPTTFSKGVFQAVQDGLFEKSGADPADSPWTLISGASIISSQTSSPASSQFSSYIARLDITVLIGPFSGPGQYSTATLYQDVYTIVGETYSLTYDTLAPVGCLFCELDIDQNGQQIASLDGWGTLDQQTESVSGNTTWATQTGSFVATTNVTRLSFYAHSALLGEGFIYIDNISLSTNTGGTSEPDCTVQPTNVVQDGTFSDPNGGAWSYASDNGYSSSSGNGALVFTFPSEAHSGTEALQILNGLVPGQQTLLAYQYNFPSAGGATDLSCNLTPQMNGRNLTGVSTASLASDGDPFTVLTGTNGYVTSQLQFVPSAATETLGFYASCLGDFGSGYKFYVRNVVIDVSELVC